MKNILYSSILLSLFSIQSNANTVEVSTRAYGPRTYTQIKLIKGSLIYCSSQEFLNETLSNSKPIEIYVPNTTLDSVEYIIEKPITSVSAPTVLNQKLCVTITK